MNVTRRQTAGGGDGDSPSDGGDEASSHHHQPETSALHHFERGMADLQTRVNRLGRRGSLVLGFSLLLSLVFYWQLARYVFVTPHSQDVYFLKMETCPACYGNDFCDHFTNSEVTFTGVYQYPIAHRLMSSTRVFEGRKGRYKGHPVIIKSLATPEQLVAVEKGLCDFANIKDPKRCNMQDALWKRLPLGEDTLTLFDIQGVNDMFRCPSQRLLDIVKDAFRLRDPDKPPKLYRNEEMTLFFTALVNPEPLILMTFTSKKKWPFPEYHGACGRFIVVEHRGEPATDLLTAGSQPSERRLVAKRILELALRLTASDNGFALYLNDWELSNFAVYPQTRTVTLVDLSNVTVVDTREFKLVAEGHHATGNFGSPADAQAVCKHRLSDWNVLGACGMLRSTLLADLPAAATDTQLGDLLDQCAGATPKVSRFQLAKSLIDALDKQN